jgi:hypothetical protein
VFLQGFLSLSQPKLEGLYGPPDASPASTDVAPVEEEIAPSETGSGGEEATGGAAAEDKPEGTGNAGETKPPAESGNAGTESNGDSPSGAEQPGGEQTSPGATPTDTPIVKVLSSPAEDSEPGTDDGAPSVLPDDPGLPGTPDDSVLPPGTLLFKYAAHQLSFKLKVDEDNPEAYAVTEINTWNKTVLSLLVKSIQASKLKPLKTPLAGGKYEMTYVWNDALYIFTYNKDVPVRLSVSPLAV